MSQNLATKLFQAVKCEQGAGDIQRDHSGYVCMYLVYIFNLQRFWKRVYILIQIYAQYDCSSDYRDAGALIGCGLHPISL